MNDEADVRAKRKRRISEIEDYLARPGEIHGPEWWIRRGQLERELERLKILQAKLPPKPVPTVQVFGATMTPDQAVELFKPVESEKKPAHSKSEYKRRVALGDPNVLPPVEKK